MAVGRTIRYFDVLFVVDDKDYSKVYMNRMLEALRSVTPPLNIGKEYIIDFRNEKETVRAEKVIFIVATPVEYLQDCLLEWMNKLLNRRNESSKCLCIYHGSQWQEIHKANVQHIHVRDLHDNLEYWPTVLKFLFTTKNSGKKVFLHLESQPGTDATSPCLADQALVSVKESLKVFDIDVAEHRGNAATSIIAVTRTIARSSEGELQKFLTDSPDMYHTTHILTSRAEDIVVENRHGRTNIHVYKDTMLCIIWALIDMKCIEAGRRLPHVPFRLRLLSAFKNMKVPVFSWWLLIILVTLFNVPAYVAYCCSPATPFVLYGVIFRKAKEINTSISAI